MSGDEAAFPVTRIETDLMGDGSGHKFPHTYTHSEDGGLTKRELFAAMAMQGMMRADDTELAPDQLPPFAKLMGQYAVAYADALLAALAESPTNCGSDQQSSGSGS